MILNSQDDSLELGKACMQLHDSTKTGSILTNFKEFAEYMDPETKGLSISNCEELRQIHNSFARQGILLTNNPKLKNFKESFSMESRQATDDDDVFHFVAYIPFHGRVYQLDGLKEAPVDHGCSFLRCLYASPL